MATGREPFTLDTLLNDVHDNTKNVLRTTVTDGTDDVGVTTSTGFTTNLDGTVGLNTASVLYGRVDNDTVAPIKVDASTQDIQVISHEHAESHSGDHYECIDVVDLSINNVRDFRMTTPNTTKWGHLTLKIKTESETDWYIYENVTIENAGTAATPINNNRNSANTAAIVIDVIDNTSTANANADTGIGSAVTLSHQISGAGKDSGEDARGKEYILKQNTIYSFRFIASVAGYVNYVFEWYEHQDKN